MGTLIQNWMLVFIWLVGAVFPLIPVSPLTSITVTTTTDVIADDGLCALREAVIAANTDTAYHDCPAGSGADLIDFGPSLPVPATFTLTLTGVNEDNAQTGDLDLLGDLTISGLGAGSTILDGNGTDRVFDIRPGAHVTISGVGIQHGNPASSPEGGGIRVQGLLTLADSSVSGNQPGGIYNLGGALVFQAVDILDNTGGYGVSNLAQASFTYTAGTVSGNQGGIYNATSTATLSDLTIVNNAGSGAYNTGATLSHLTIYHSVVMTNTATSGAGIFNQGVGALADINETRISGNTATASGGGAFNNGIMAVNRSTIDHNQARSGGGIEHFGGTLGLTNVTLSNNSASDNGGGLYNESSATLRQVTLEANMASGLNTGGNIFNDNAQMSIGNSIVAHSHTDGNCFNSGGILNSLGHNLESANTCGFSAAGDITNTDPLLGPLQNNGGSTLTHALMPGSPAIDTADNVGCPATDQRGVARPQGANCDIGAFELIPGQLADLSVTKVDARDPVTAGGLITYTVTVSNAGPDTALSVVLSDDLPGGVDYVSATPQQGSCGQAHGVITCSLGDIFSGGSVPVEMVVTAAMVGTVTNQVEVVSVTSDPNPANNTASESTTVNPASIEVRQFLPLIKN